MRFTADIEIPRFIISVDLEADSWGDAIMKASEINPIKFIKAVEKATLMDSDEPRVVGLLLQD